MGTDQGSADRWLRVWRNARAAWHHHRMTEPGDAFLRTLPPTFRDVPWIEERFPGAPGVDGVEAGANCQVYAYAVLRHFGWQIPPLRSSELLADTTATVCVTGPPEPLDLMLFGKRADAYGAHVGVYVGDGEVLHLSKEVGRPAVWPLDEFRRRRRYQLVFVKRPTLRVT